MTEEKSSFGDFAGAITALSEEKGIDKDDVFSTVEVALAAAYKKEYGKRGQNVRAELDAVSGDMKFFLVKEVVDESTRDFTEPEDLELETSVHTAKDPVDEDSEDEDAAERLIRFNEERDIILEDALKRDADIKIGDTLEEDLPTYTDFGRVAAQTAKQVIIQRVREAERDAMYAEYKEKEGEMANGTVQRIEGRTVFVDLGKSVGVLFPREQVRDEHFTMGQRLKVYIESVELDPRGPGIKLSRIHPDMVRHLFEMEVPEIFSGIVELKAIAREAGSRSKIAVSTEDSDIDPVGSCVGQKGTRVNAVIDALGGEKIDIIEWNEDVEDFIAAALSPAQVTSVELNEETKHARVVVPDDQLSLAIGKRGQNVRLAVKLTGWDLDVESADAPINDAAQEDIASAPKEAKTPTDDEPSAGTDTDTQVNEESETKQDDATAAVVKSTAKDQEDGVETNEQEASTEKNEKK